jgi:hypothetical protein
MPFRVVRIGRAVRVNRADFERLLREGFEFS